MAFSAIAAPITHIYSGQYGATSVLNSPLPNVSAFLDFIRPDESDKSLKEKRQSLGPVSLAPVGLVTENIGAIAAPVNTVTNGLVGAVDNL
jgi:hypothetical protein